MENEKIERLRERVEKTLGTRMSTPRDFELLSESVFRHTGVLMSTTTLKRLWGYINETVTPRHSTLDTLARYAGWSGWDNFCRDESPEDESGFVAANCIDVLKQLRRGDKVRLMWQPGRVCDIEYEGEGTFKIIRVEGSKLIQGSTFLCYLIMSGEPLFLDNLTTPTGRSGTYVCGCVNGVSFVRL